MIRVMNIIAIAFTVVFAFGLYSFKYNTGVAADQVRLLESEIEEQEEALRILRAEWAHLIRADRLQRLAEKHLDLRPLGPGQIAEVRDIPVRSVRAATVEEDTPLSDDLVEQSPFDIEGLIRQSGAAFSITPKPKPVNLSRGGNVNG